MVTRMDRNQLAFFKFCFIRTKTIKHAHELVRLRSLLLHLQHTEGKWRPYLTYFRGSSSSLVFFTYLSSNKKVSLTDIIIDGQHDTFY